MQPTYCSYFHRLIIGRLTKMTLRIHPLDSNVYIATDMLIQL